jgi:hypothetical protein
MNIILRTLCFTLLSLFTLIAFGPFSPMVAQEVPSPKPITLACAVNASSQLLGSTPVGDGSESLVLVRVIFGPGGSIGQHTHPGTLTVVVESGSLGFTLVDEGYMTITRAATDDADPTEESAMTGVEMALNPGDGFVEMGMVHSATNLGDTDTSVLFAGLVETGAPVTACATQALLGRLTRLGTARREWRGGALLAATR